MVQLDVLLPLLLQSSSNNGSTTTTSLREGNSTLLDANELVQQLHDAHIYSALDLLLVKDQSTPLAALHTLRILNIKDKIADFLAAEGRPADELYAEAHPNISPEDAYTATNTNPSLAASAAGSASSHGGLYCTTGVPAIDKALGGGWRDEVVEVVGEHGSGKTTFILHTILRHLSEHPNEYALWLDTTSTFSAEWGSQILESIRSQKASSSSSSLSNENDNGTDSNAPVDARIEQTGKSPLDRLIVAKAFDLASAIQAIQQVRKDIYDSTSASSATDADDNKSDVQMEGELKVDEKPLDASVEQQFTNVVPETAGPAEIELVSSPGQSANNPSSRGPKEASEKPTSEQADASAEEGGGEPRDRSKHLRFIVIDNIAVLLKGVLTATSAEGHARMMSFMRLLHALTKSPAPAAQYAASSKKIVSTKTIATVFVVNNLVPLSAAANSTAAFHSVFPALDAKRVKAALGPTFTYLTDWTIYLSDATEAFGQHAVIAPLSMVSQGHTDGNKGRRMVFEIVRSRRMPQSRWIAYTQTSNGIDLA